MPKHLAYLVTHRSSICWDCHRPFKLEPEQTSEPVQRTHPICPICTAIQAGALKPPVTPTTPEEPKTSGFKKCRACQFQLALLEAKYDSMCMDCYNKVNPESESKPAQSVPEESKCLECDQSAAKEVAVYEGLCLRCFGKKMGLI